jgi:hypothetical protein
MNNYSIESNVKVASQLITKTKLGVNILLHRIGNVGSAGDRDLFV